jgi:hypothetical protein
MFLSGSIAVVRDDSSAFGDHLFKSVGRTKDRQVMLGCLERAVKPHKRIVIHRDSKFIVQTRLLEFVRVIAPIFSIWSDAWACGFYNVHRQLLGETQGYLRCQNWHDQESIVLARQSEKDISNHRGGKSEL